ncbi:MAG: urease accessory protein UreD [Gammaproteobacteria bacterium]
MPADGAIEQQRGWRGALALRFASRGGKTVLAERRHEGPLYIQQTFSPGDGVCHAYLLHPPGGLAGGDELTLDARCDPGARVLLTTPAATKFYRSDGLPSVQRQRLHVAADATLEWLPLDTILFGGSRATIETSVELARGARFIGWEQLSLGRPLSGDHYAAGWLEQRTRISVAGEPLLIDTLRWRAGDRLLDAEWGLAGFGVCGALQVFPADARLLAPIRGLLGAVTPSSHELRCAATLLGELLVVRCLSHSAERMRNLLEELWALVRTAVIGCAPSPPRIWRT